MSGLSASLRAAHGGFGRFWLECRACGRSREAGSLRYRCASCGGELVVRYAAASDGWQDPARRGVWRYRGRLPLHDPANIVSLGEGATPLVELTGAVPGIASVQVKCEHLNPTGSFKDRIASVALSIVRERRLAGCVGTSSGNGGAAAAAYASRAGVPAALFALADTAAPKLRQIRALGARVHLVDGLGHDAAATDCGGRHHCRDRRRSGPDAAADRRPVLPRGDGGRDHHRVRDRRGRPATTVVYAPVGGGGLVSAIGRGFAADGLLRRRARPRVVGGAARPDADARARRWPATSAGCGAHAPPPSPGCRWRSSSTAPGAVDAVRDSGGHLTEVTDEQIAASAAHPRPAGTASWSNRPARPHWPGPRRRRGRPARAPPTGW